MAAAVAERNVPENAVRPRIKPSSCYHIASIYADPSIIQMGDSCTQDMLQRPLAILKSYEPKLRKILLDTRNDIRLHLPQEIVYRLIGPQGMLDPVDCTAVYLFKRAASSPSPLYVWIHSWHDGYTDSFRLSLKLPILLEDDEYDNMLIEVHSLLEGHGVPVKDIKEAGAYSVFPTPATHSL